MLDNAAGVKITHVPYRGARHPAITDSLGGHVDMLNADLPVLLPLVKAGPVKALALFAPERAPQLPDLPTTKELGLPDVIMETGTACSCPPARHGVRDKLEQALTPSSPCPPSSSGSSTTACTACSATSLRGRRWRAIRRRGRTDQDARHHRR